MTNSRIMSTLCQLLYRYLNFPVWFFFFGIPFCSGSLLAQMVCVIEKHPPYHGKKGVVIYAW